MIFYAGEEVVEPQTFKNEAMFSRENCLFEMNSNI